MNFRSLYLMIFCIVAFNCSGNKSTEEYSSEYRIIRFDKDLYQFLKGEGDKNLLYQHPLFLKEYGEKVIYIGSPDSTGFINRLDKFFSEPTLMKIYEDQQIQFDNIEAINRELAEAMDSFLKNFLQVKKPQIYMHVSGLNQNVIVTDEILSLSVDKYLGVGYPLYKNFFYDYQRQTMSADRIVPDYLLGFMMANFPFQGNDELLLDRILYEGKLRYILSVILPDRNEWEYVGYNKEQYEWCTIHESRIWKSILENQHLFQPDYKTTQQYLVNAPYTSSLPTESPGRVGVWLGYQIISTYMKKNPNVSLLELVQKVDYQELLKQSKYKP